MDVPVIFERSVPHRQGIRLPECDVPTVDIEKELGSFVRTSPLNLPEVSELDVVRHYTYLSSLNYGVDTGFYPLGSCTMKYNPKVNESVASLPGFADLHPLQPDDTVQGMLAVMRALEDGLAEISGMDAVSLQPAAGAHGELTGILVIRAYLEAQGQKRTTILVPDSAHGTNPATAAMAGFKVKVVPSNARGGVDVQKLREIVDEETAGLMLTNPNTLGLFEEDILEIADIVHGVGGLLYYDGANANAIMGKVRPGDMGFDVVHLNLHKTFSTPHGGGGPGAGPVGVKKPLEPFLPLPRIQGHEGHWYWDYNRPQSIGKVRSYYGNPGILIRAYAYLRSHGAEGLKNVSETAVLNANYLLHLLKERYQTPFNRPVKHEFVLSLTPQKKRGARALDVAKRLIDYGVYPPTVYFPLVVEEAMMVEPTETESKETLDRFAASMIQIDEEIDTQPSLLHEAPHHTIVSRLDEAQAARHPILTYFQKDA
ncbi:aminomethyl-transferring glycine dehydrogenase subunit GcvPB [Sulfobacillus thermosulfidooxidans]|uniref:aminomethyl-transferring glycine dehydrogenase subunit GcvPB n=1 Tax=Sulfobacillus thermosulfidooxidans TaxID=28034 RepID=UPI00096B6D06|nr:aminomethyl-transferring glycine dehydrogenase subunit GcvPB [Sulfobacillus thermosulfidooxidans]OLZ08555.1 glycine dehydrogenase (aminomethyl-transferring) [Sulfobacillus thermosulfidooxidans]OLZ13157.1 glycine dehydrogenase (aminomethyl-transferring) [Sulfobacillus thermosulfidooxidans]OLZ21537.1 glycine dehydrogenase (aminomethyl-transferring) [Sulfobacillus thermosulfidooxidans]